MTNILSQLHAGTDPFVGDRMQQFSQQRQINNINIRRDQEQNALNKIVGGALANDDFSGARKLAFQGGDLDMGTKIGEIMQGMNEQERAQARQAMQDSLLIRKAIPDPEKARVEFMNRYPNADADDLAVFDQPVELHEALARGFENFTERQDKLADKTSDRAFTTSERVAGQKFAATQKALDRAQRKALAASSATGPNAKTFKNTSDLRKEFTAVTKDFTKVRDAYGRITAATEDPSAAGDLALIFNFMKMLDPGSVVRESEFATAANAGGVPERIRAQYNRVVNGERLSTKMRGDFIGQSERLFDGQARIFNETRSRFEGIAQRNNLPAEDITFDIRAGLNATSGGGSDTSAEVPQVSSDADFNALPSGAVFIDPEGNRRRKP